MRAQLYPAAGTEGRNSLCCPHASSFFGFYNFFPSTFRENSLSEVVAEQVGGEQLSILSHPPLVQRQSPPTNPELSSGRGEGDSLEGRRRLRGCTPWGRCRAEGQIQLVSLSFRLFTRLRSGGLPHQTLLFAGW